MTCLTLLAAVDLRGLDVSDAAQRAVEEIRREYRR
jgi:hypothetical protein